MENPFVFFEGDDLQNISDQLERHYGIGKSLAGVCFYLLYI